MIAITGGAGFIGSALAWHLNRAGRHEILLVDRLGKGEKYRNLAGLNLADYWEADEFIGRMEAGKPLPSIEAVVHLGACSSTTEDDASFLMRNNFAYSRALAEWCLERGVRFIYASSAATYGDGRTGYADDERRLAQLLPLNKYGLSKHAFDLWAAHRGALRSITGLKFFNVYGPNEYHKGAMRSMVVKGYEEIRRSGSVRLFKSYRPDYADGEQVRDFIYVKDAVAIAAWFLDHPRATGIFNVGSGRAESWNQLAASLFEAMGRPPKIEYVEMPDGLREKYQYSTRAEMSRLREQGCTIAVRPLREGVAEYVNKYLEGNLATLAELDR
jgi:ADP-L-glycero-D-manno-heptose 6-epimerase